MPPKLKKAPKKPSKIYVGIRKGGKRELFRSTRTPTNSSHGERYFAVVGPFRTKGGAEVMRDSGGCAYIQTVSDAERIAKARRDAQKRRK